MSDRWQLSRAGITNVYQYDQEILTFGGGRLLLRGVNGSGKSTAMNMLLPFLLEADTRRIDAAGEQSRVLRAWMLTGREEQQPVGYLWIEFARGDEHLTVGCGLKANRSTDQVRTWWFVTPRRPGIDLDLVVGRHPVSAEVLRGELGVGAVFNHDQRAAYRQEVRRLLYGGADLDQHLRLLHVVRNPRVGDRIDVDLPNYLTDALPQLSEAALDDAAQPLEDLEEHRRNVEHLTRTVGALKAIEATYCSYARAEVHRRLDHADLLVRGHEAARRAHQRVARERAEAATALTSARVTASSLDDEGSRLREEIRTLEASEAYQAGHELEDRRRLERQLADQLARDEQATERADGQVTAAAMATVRAASDADTDTTALRSALDDLSALAGDASLAVSAPDLSPVGRVSAELSVADGPDRPVQAFDADALVAAVAPVRAAAQHRTGDIDDVRQRLDAARRAERTLDEAARRHRDAVDAEGRAAQVLTAAESDRTREHHDWDTSFTSWSAQLSGQRAEAGLDGRASIDGSQADDGQVDADPERRHRVGAELAHELVDHLGQAVARVEAVRAGAAAEVERCAAEVAALAARTLPDPPATEWQRVERGPVLAEVIEFAAEVSEADRLGIEAALLASGLLGAELHADGSLVTGAGDLRLQAGSAVDRPLAGVLMIDVPEALAATVDTDALRRLLASISVDPGQMARDDGPPVITADGRFRTGPLRGGHVVERAEHVGSSARWAALERQRAEAAETLTSATEARDHAEERLRAVQLSRAGAQRLRSELPTLAALARAVEAVRQAALAVDAAADLRRERAAEEREAERASAAAVDEVRRMASTHGLPHDPAELEAVRAAVGRVAPACDRLAPLATSLARWVRQWAGQADRWLDARTDATRARTERDHTRSQFREATTSLATLEDAIGLDHRRVMEAIDTSQRDLARATSDLGDAWTALEGAITADAHAVSALDRAEVAVAEAAGACTRWLPGLRRALAVPGFLLAATSPGDQPEPTNPAADNAARAAAGSRSQAPAALPTVDESPDGLRTLAAAVRAAVPAPAGTMTTAEGVRISLRARRDSLGAGWDAADHQPDEQFPLHIEVDGPTGRSPIGEATAAVATDLARQSGLLSTEQDQALRNLLQGLVAREVAQKLDAARRLVRGINDRLDTIRTGHGIGVSLRWKRRDDLDERLASTVDLLAKLPDLRTAEEDQRLSAAVATRIAEARLDDPERPYRELIGEVLDYRSWHRMDLVLKRANHPDEVLRKRTALSEGEKKMVSYLPLFAAVAASCDAVAEGAEGAPRFVLLDDAFAKVSEDNHAKLFGLLVDLDLDFIATSERLWGTHATVPELAITEVIRDADLGAIVLEHSRWDGHQRTPA